MHTLDLPKELNILIIGETGSGKSTLINNLLGKEMAEAGHDLTAGTTDIKRYTAEVRGVPICLYDTPGARNMDRAADRRIQKGIKDIIKQNNIHLIIFCVSLQSIRFTDGHLATLKFYHGAGIKWKNTVFALTFADRVKASSRETEDAGYDKAEYFTGKIRMWHETIKEALERIGVPQNVADGISVCATADNKEMKLQNGEEWFEPLFLKVLKAMPPTASFRFFDMNSEAILNEHADLVKCHSGVLQVLKEQLMLLGLQSGRKLGFLALGVTALTVGGIAMTKGAVIAGAATFGVGAVLAVGAGITLIVIGVTAVCICRRINAAKEADEDDS